MTLIELNGGKLISARRKIPVPFSISVSIGVNAQEVQTNQEIRTGCQDLSLNVSKLFRVLPGKRIVALAETAGQKCVVKIFLGRTANRYALKETEGAQAVKQAGLLTPALLWQGRLEDGSGQVLAFRYLEDSRDLEHLWEDFTGKDQKLKLLRDSVAILATMHNGGIQQEDIHLNNFVVCHGDIYTIDGGGMDLSAKGSPLSSERSMRNLAWFFAQFHPVDDLLIDEIFSTYEALRGWTSSPGRLRRLRRKTRRLRRERKNHYVAKSLRECTRFVCESSLTRFMVCERSKFSGDINRLLADPDGVIEDAIEKGDMLKNGNTATVVRVSAGEGQIVIKRYNVKSWWHAIRRSFRKSRARISWINAHQLDFLGITSMKPVAMLEQRMGPFIGKAYFICDYVEGTNADRCFDDLVDASNLPHKEDMIKVLGALGEAMISHGDLKASNFRITETGVTLLDLDALREHKRRKAFKKAFKKDIRRFLRNWEKNPQLYGYFKTATEQLINRRK